MESLWKADKEKVEAAQPHHYFASLSLQPRLLMCAETSTKENITQTNNYSVSEKGLSEETNREMVWRHHIVSLLPRGNHSLCPKTSNNRARPIISDKVITTPTLKNSAENTLIPIGKQHVLLHIYYLF